MNIINEVALDYLDEISNSDPGGGDEKHQVSIQPSIKDIGDIGVSTRIGI